uniref:NADH dehydrogenase subunit 6 n=1 Tax=Plectus sambesii TaxID=2011161 RepID=A0A914VF06_9BILA
MSCRLAYPYAVYRREKDSKMMIVLGLLFVTFLILSIAVIVAWAVISDGFKNLGGLPDVCTSA